MAKHEVDEMQPITSEEIYEWIVNYVASVLKIDKAMIRRQATFSSLGFDSTAAVGMTNALGEYLSLELDVTLCFDYPRLGELAGYVAEKHASAESARSA